MRIIGVSAVLATVSAVQAGLMPSLDGSFDAPAYTTGTSLNNYGQLGWYCIPDMLINSNHELDLHNSATATHDIASGGSFVNSSQQSGTKLCMGFTLNFTQIVLSEYGAAANKLFEFEQAGAPFTLSLWVTASADYKSVLLHLTSNGAVSNQQTITVKLNSPTRLLLTVTPPLSYGERTVYLSDAAQVTGNDDYASNAAILSSVNSKPVTKFYMMGTPDYVGTIDDIKIGNSAAEVSAVAHAPEPATALLSLPMAAGLVMRRKRARMN